MRGVEDVPWEEARGEGVWCRAEELVAEVPELCEVRYVSDVSLMVVDLADGWSTDQGGYR